MIESNNIHIRDLEPILFNPCDFFSEEDGDQWGKNSYSAAVSFIEEKSLEGYLIMMDTHDSSLMANLNNSPKSCFGGSK